MSDFGKFRINTPRKIHIIKNHSIWISIHREIEEQNLDIKFDHQERENIEKL